MNELIDETIKVLEQMKREGITHVNVLTETLEQLGKPFPFRATASGDAAYKAIAPQPVAGRVTSHGESDLDSELAHLAARAKACTKCSELARCRTNVVFGVGDPHAELMFIGEAPGFDEDQQGEPFVGRAGQLLTKIIIAMGFERKEVYIANVLKCRPPENRTPLPDEVQNCLPFLLTQIELIRPKVMVALGATAMRALLGVEIGITKMRGHWYTFRDTPIMPTFHPAYLLRNPPAKKDVWEDMQEVVRRLGREIPQR